MAKLRQEQVQAILLLLEGDKKKQEIAAEVGVQPKTLSRWLADPDFAAELIRKEKEWEADLSEIRLRSKKARLLELERILAEVPTTVPGEKGLQVFAAEKARIIDQIRDELGQKSTKVEVDVEVSHKDILRQKIREIRERFTEIEDAEVVPQALLEQGHEEKKAE